MEILRRRKRLFLGLAAGAAGAAATYYWWANYTSTKLQQQRSVEMELSAILRGSGLQQAGDDAEGSAADGDSAGDDCGSPDLDESLDSHFKYIQKVSAPQELSGLLPRIKDTLFRLTDVSIIKQRQQQQQQQQQTPGSAAGGVQSQLQLLACLCFSRTVAAAYLLPLMDLCVRTKLNIIGRHLFLQEKFSKLRQPAAPAARMQLPPRLTAAAVEAFLACEQLAERGCAWMVEQAMAAAEDVLQRVPMDTAVTPEELAELVQAVAAALAEAVTAAGAVSPTGNAWVDAIVGPAVSAGLGLDAAAAAGSGDAYKRARANAAMVEELETELRRVLCNYRFGEALHASVSQCLSTCAAHIHATFISQAAAAAQALPARPAPLSSPDGNQAPASDEALAGPQQQQQQPGAVVSPFVNAAEECTPDPQAPCQAPCSAAGSTASSDAAAALQAPSPEDAAASARRAGSGGGARLSLAAAAVAAMQPRPLARCLKAVQGACEPLFTDAKEVSARIACLPPVMSLCAVAFAAPLEL